MLSGLSPAIRRASCVVTGLLLGAAAFAGPPVLLLENAQLQIALSRDDGRLLQFTDRKAKWNHVADQATPLGLWKLELRRNGKGVALTPAQAKLFQAE